MNENVVERFGRGKAFRDSRMPRTSTPTATMTDATSNNTTVYVAAIIARTGADKEIS